MSVNPIEQVALEAIEFIEDLTADPLLDSEDVEMSLEDVQAHACIEAASLRKRLAAALEADASKIERRGLERAAAEIEKFGDALESTIHGQSNVAKSLAAGVSAARSCAELVRALIPEAPVREAE